MELHIDTGIFHEGPPNAVFVRFRATLSKRNDYFTLTEPLSPEQAQRLRDALGGGTAFDPGRLGIPWNMEKHGYAYFPGLVGEEGLHVPPGLVQAARYTANIPPLTPEQLVEVFEELR